MIGSDWFGHEEIIDYKLNSCIEGQKPKNNIRGRKSVWNHPNKGVFGVLKSESILPEPSPAIELRKRKV